MLEDSDSNDDKEKFLSYSVGPKMGQVLKSNFNTLFGRTTTTKPTIESTFQNHHHQQEDNSRHNKDKDSYKDGFSTISGCSTIGGMLGIGDKRMSLNPIQVCQGTPALLMSPVSQANVTLIKPSMGSHSNLRELKLKHERVHPSLLNPNRTSILHESTWRGGMKKSPSLNNDYESKSKAKALNQLSLDLGTRDQRFSALSLEDSQLMLKEQRKSVLSLEDFGYKDKRDSGLSLEEKLFRLSGSSDLGYCSTSPGTSSPKHRSIKGALNTLCKSPDSIVEESDLERIDLDKSEISPANSKATDLDEPTPRPVNKKLHVVTPGTARLSVHMDSNKFSPLSFIEPPLIADETTPRLSYLDLSQSTNDEKIAIEKDKKRYNLVLEILNTEITYVNGLKLIDSCFYQPLVQHPDVGKKVVGEIFSNFRDILNVNTELLKQLITKTKPTFNNNMDIGSGGGEMPLADGLDWDNTTGKVGGIFRTLCPFLKMYSNYVKNFPAAVSLINKPTSSSKPAIGARHDELKLVRQLWSADSTVKRLKGLSVEAYLIMPVQRIPRYVLLLQQLLNATSNDHVDYDDIKEALRLVKEVASFVNEMIRYTEMTMQILTIQNKLQHTTQVWMDKPLLQPGRRLIKMGRVNKISRKSRDARQLFLFSDVMLVTTPTTNNWTGFMEASNSEADVQYRLNRVLDLDDIHVLDSDDTSTSEGEKSVETRNGVQVINTLKSFAFYCDTYDDKQEWLTLINKSKQDPTVSRSTLKPLENQSFVSGNSTSVASSFMLDKDESFTSSSSILSPKFSQSTLALDPKYKSQLEAIIGAQNTHDQDRVKIVDNYKAPVWVPDDAVSVCFVCQAEFNLFKRKHHCRLCGKVVCHMCSENTFLILNTAHLAMPRIARGCDHCFVDRGWPLNSQSEARSGLLDVANLRRYSFLNSTVDTLDSSFQSTSTIASAVPRRLTRNGSSTLRLYPSENGLRESYLTTNNSDKSLARPASSIFQFSNQRSKRCELCLTEFGVFNWKNVCKACAKTVCNCCLSKRFHDELVCDPCSLGVDPGAVNVLEDGGGWSVLE